MRNAIKTTHDLDFEACPWPRDKSIMLFKIGSCHGQYVFSDMGLEIISIINNTPGNGHLNDVFEWFEYAAKAQGLKLIIREFFNARFKMHCILKRGYSDIAGMNSVMKDFSK